MEIHEVIVRGFTPLSYFSKKSQNIAVGDYVVVPFGENGYEFGRVIGKPATEHIEDLIEKKIKVKQIVCKINFRDYSREAKELKNNEK